MCVSLVIGQRSLSDPFYNERTADDTNIISDSLNGFNSGLKPRFGITASCKATESCSKTASYSQRVLNTKPSSKNNVTQNDKTSIARTSKNFVVKGGQIFLSILDYIFVKKLLHAKGCDIAVLIMFGLIILGISLSILAPHLSLLHFVLIGQLWAHPVFGGLNIAVGLALAVQSIKNIRKAIESKNKEEIIIGIISLLFSMAIVTTGAVAIANLSNDILLKSLFTICAGFGLGIGSYNFVKTQIFRKQLQDAKNTNTVKEFLKNKIQPNENETKALKTKIDKLTQEEREQQLRKKLTKIEFEEIQKKSEEVKKDKLLTLELEIIEKRKIAKLEKILRSELTKKIQAFIKSSKNEDKDLKNAIFKELNKRTIAESLRILAPMLSIGAFGINQLSLFNSIQVQNLVYYSTMLTSKLSGFWLNYVPAWRNVPNTDTKTTTKPYHYPETNPLVASS